jgi:hypothetical protein
MEKNMNKKSYNVLNIVVIILLIVNAVYLITQKKAEKTVTDREPVSVDLVMRALNMKYFKINIDAAAGDENKGIFLEKVTPNGVVSSREIQNLKHFPKGETLYLFLREDGEKVYILNDSCWKYIFISGDIIPKTVYGDVAYRNRIFKNRRFFLSGRK